MKSRLGRIEAQFLAYAQLRRLRTVKVGDLGEPLQLSRKQERELLSRLSRAGLIARVRSGLYLIPPGIPLGGSWSPDGILALNTLMADRGAACQICGPNAFSRYGFDDQVPNRIYAYNDRISGERVIGVIRLQLIKVNSRRLGETELSQATDGEEAVYSSRTRTLLDAVYDWSRFNSLPRAYRWILDELSSERVKPEDLVRVTLQYGNLGTIRRIGVLLESADVSDPLVNMLEKNLSPTTATIPWVPSMQKRGHLSRRWGVVINDEI